MDVDIGKRLEEKARYIVQIQVFKDFPETFRKTMGSILTREYGSTNDSPYYGFDSQRKAGIRFIGRSGNPQTLTLSGPLERKEVMDKYVDEALEKYFETNKNKPEINRKISSTLYEKKDF